ncbi:MAG: hypothetical protein ACXVA9_07775 [Bdellovibrionales bacterium]
MKLLITVLSYLFSGLQMVTSVLVFPLTILCTLGLILFTLKIARDMKANARLLGPPEADRLHA